MRQTPSSGGQIAGIFQRNVITTLTTHTISEDDDMLCSIAMRLSSMINSNTGTRGHMSDASQRQGSAILVDLLGNIDCNVYNTTNKPPKEHVCTTKARPCL